ITAHELELDKLEKPSTKREASTRVFSDEKIDFAWLSNVNGELTVKIESIKKGKLTISYLDTKATIKDKVLELFPLSFTLANGTTEGNFRIEHQGNQNKVALNLNGSNLKLDSLMKDLTGSKDFEGGNIEL